MAYQKKQTLNLRSFAATPAAPSISNQGAAGATAYSYKAVAVDADGNHTAASAAGSTATGNATEDGTNFNRLSGLAVPPGFDHVDLYRTAGGATQGKIGSITGATTTFDDTGLAGDASTAPSSASAGLGISDPITVGMFERFTTALFGLTGTWKIQVSVDDGAHFFDSTAGNQTNSTFADVTSMCDQMRVAITAQSAGVPTGVVKGLYSHEGG